MTPSAEELLAIARQYWRSDNEYQLRGERSPETERLHALWKQEGRRLAEWQVMLEELRQELPDASVNQITTTSDACFRCAIYSRREQRTPLLVQVVVGCMSILAPVYTVYGLKYEYRRKKRLKTSNEQLFLEALPPELRGPAEAFARRVEARFSVSRLPPEVAATPIPLFVDLKWPPHATLFHALFSSEPLSVP
jgi:hypothetical protein